MITEFFFLTYFVQPAAAASDVFRSTTYELQSGEFTGTTYTLTLNNDLESDYFVMISGPSISTTTRSPDEDNVRVSADPHSNFGSSTSANELELTRGDASFNWIGALTVMECLTACSTIGFTLSEVLETSLTAGVAGAQDTDTDTLAANHTANTVPFGGRFGGGLSTSDTNATAYAVTGGAKITKTGSNQISYDRYGAEADIPAAATFTTYIVEWGSEWTVQNVNVTGTASGSGLDATGEWDTTTITSTTRANTWVWGNGFTRDDGLGDGAYGQAITLGNGVNENTDETTVAVGSEGGLIAPGRDFQVYVMEHSKLAVDYRFRSRGDTGSGSGFQELDATVDAPLNTETYDNTATDVQYTEGYRVPLFYNTSGGTGEAYSRTGGWGLRHDASANLNYWRAYAGQPITGWFQSIDFGDIDFSNVDTRQENFRWRDDTIDLNTTGGWLAAEDTNPSAQAKNTDLRLRIKAANFGTTPEDAGRTYELQFATKAASCSVSTGWTGVSDSATDAFELYNSSNISPDGEVTTSSLLSSGGLTYVNGEGRESADTTNTIGPMAANAYTEIEYALRATDDAITGRDYCFRLYDTTAADVLDGYTVYPELTVASTGLTFDGLGEAGTFTSAVDGGWTAVSFTGTYTTPVVVGTTNTQNGQNALVFEARNVTSTGADMRVCESEGATANGCDTHAAETVGYMVIDAAVADDIDGIEAGTFTASGQADTNAVTTNYTESFSATPYVFSNVNTVTSTEFPIEVVITSTSTSSFTAGICDHLLASNDACDGTHGNETVGWVAIEPGNEPFTEQNDNGTQSIGNSTWTAITYAAYSSAPVLIVSSQTDNGGQDVEIDEARLVTTTGADIRYCEIDTLDTCDSHANDDVAWQAIESGVLDDALSVDIDQDGFRFYDNTDAITPTVATGAENTDIADVDNGDVLRIRMALQTGETGVSLSDFDTKLQYGVGATCSAIGTWTDVGGIGSGVIWRGFDNASVSDGATLPSSLLDGAGNTLATYEESNNSALNPNRIDATDRGEWDWVIENNGAANFTSYCFRMVRSDGTLINYTRYPKLTTSTGVANLSPNSPTNLDQERTTTTSITVGEVINEITVVFKADVSDQNANDILQLCIEVDQTGTAFSNTEDACGPTVTYTGTALEAELTLSTFVTGNDYHWQARVKDAGGLYSSWVSFGGNAESAADFSVDTVDPTGTVYDGTTTGVDIEFNGGELDELSANWNITDADSGISLFEYSVGTSPDGTDIVGWTSAGLGTSFTATSLSLETSEIYYVNVRATDVAGNEVVINADGQQVAPTLVFSTSTESSGVLFDNLNAGNSFTDTEDTVLTTSTNARNGYAVRSYITASLENALLSTIGEFDGGTYASPDTWQGGDTGYGYTSNDPLVDGVNRFNAPVCPGGGSGGPCFAPYSLLAPGDIVADNPGIVSGTPITNEQFTITHRVTTDGAQQQGTYQTTVIFQATAVY